MKFSVFSIKENSFSSPLKGTKAADAPPPQARALSKTSLPFSSEKFISNFSPAAPSTSETPFSFLAVSAETVISVPSKTACSRFLSCAECRSKSLTTRFPDRAALFPPNLARKSPQFTNSAFSPPSDMTDIFSSELPTDGARALLPDFEVEKADALQSRLRLQRGLFLKRSLITSKSPVPSG